LGHINFGIELGPAGRPDSINNPLQLISHTKTRALAKKGAVVAIELVGAASDQFNRFGDVGAEDVCYLVPTFSQRRNRPRGNVVVLFSNQRERLEHRARGGR
jgi:hypothetical protein